MEFTGIGTDTHLVLTFSEVAHLASKTLLSVLFFDNVFSDTIRFLLLSKITKLLLFE